MKKRLLAMLLALMLVVGLLPVGVLADDVPEYITTTFSNGSGERDVTVNVIGPNNEDFGTHTYRDVSGGANTITLTLTNDDYEIAYVDNNSVWNKPHSITSVSKTSNSYSFLFSSVYDLVLTVYLIESTGDPSVSGDINRLTVSYRIYDDQVLKMLYSKNVDVDENTEIVSIKPTWTKEFGSESNKGFTGINREEDYAHLVVTSDSADREEVSPTNISYITIAYTNGGMEDSVQIPAGELEFTREEEALSPYYNITLNNDEFHVVYFYNEEGANTGNNYALYAVRFVNHGESLGEDMPADPDYGTGNLYRFVNWEQGSYDGTGEPFFSTTVVEDDLTVFARKVSSSDYGGSEIHVMNPDNALLNLVVERYNENSDTPINVEDIDRDSVKINAYDAAGNTTNKDYYNNEWRSYNSVEYYWVCNYRVPSGVANLTNTHIGYDDITGINVFFTVGGEEKNVSIPVGENAGDIAKSLDNTENIIELKVISGGEEPGPGPDEPEQFTLTTSADSNSTIDEGKTFEYSEEGTITVKFSANTGYKIATVTVDGSALTGDALASAIENGFVTVDMKGNHSVGVTSEAKTSDWQTVRVVIYRNGDITKPYATIDVPGYETGDTIYTEDFNINDYYTKDKFATDFVFDGWFDDGRWNKYKGAGCPEDGFTTVDEIYVNGWKNVIAMVWDVYPVNYHVLDEDGNEIDNKTDYITERDLAGYKLWDYSKAGHTFDGWYENDKDIGNDNKKEPVPLAPLKKYELYGLCDPIPQHLEIYAAIDKNKEEAVKIYSDMVDYGTPLVAYLETLDLKTDVFPGYSPEDGKWYKYDSPKWTFGENDTVSGWTKVLINYVPNEYTIYYHGSGGVTESGAEQSTSNFKYGSEVTIKNNPFTYEGYAFEGWALSAEGGVGDVVYTGGEDVTFNTETFPGLLANGRVDLYAVWAEDKLGGGDDGNEPDGTPDYRQVFVKYVAADGNGSVDPSFETFNLAVDENGKVMTVPLSLKGKATPNADATFAYWTIEGLGYNGGAYSYEDDLFGKDFTGYFADQTYTFKAHFNGPVVKPEQVPYNINVEVVNGTAEFKGTNIGANSVINVYPIEDDNKNVTITFVPKDGFVFDAAYVGNEPVGLEDNSYTFDEVTADVTIKVLFKQDSVPITPVTPMPTPGEISDLIKDSITVDCVNGEVAHADKLYGLLDGSLVKVEKTDDTSIKVTLDATVYQARYNTDTETKHSLADGQSATVTFALNYVDQRWSVERGELPITIKVVCETPVEPDPDITDFSKTLVKDRNLYVYQGLAYPTFYRGSVRVDEGDGVTLLYKITVKGTPGTEFTVRDDSADFAQTGVILPSGETSFYVAKTFTWREIRRADELTNTAAVLLDGEVADSDTETVDVYIDWDYNPPMVDDDDDDDDEVFVPNWLNTTDHYAYIVGYEDGEVKPNNNITRAEVATIFFRLLTDDARAYYWSTDSGFSDVKPGDWYNNAVSTMVNAGILNGYSDGTFKPNANITRAEFATIAARFLSNSYSLNDRFYDTEGHWAEPYINRAAEVGWINGYNDGSFKPDRAITRAEAVTLVNAVLGREPHEDHLLNNMVTWPDNPKFAWYYEDIQEATNSHDYVWASGNAYEIWTKLLENRNWAKLEKEWSNAYSAPGGNVMG